MSDSMLLELARDLVTELEADKLEAADQILAMIAAERESKLFEEIGKLTRELHDSLNHVELDSQIAGLAEHDFPDAKERLTFVIEKTDAAAHRTMTAVEELMPVSEGIMSNTDKILNDWTRFQNREMKVDEFKKMGDELVDFMKQLQGNSNTIHDGLSNILMAQDYQDITGQVLRKVIDMVQGVEEKLVELIRATGVQAETKKPVDKIEAEGPQINQEKNENVMNSQDEVDDLLSSLGF